MSIRRERCSVGSKTTCSCVRAQLCDRGGGLQCKFPDGECETIRVCHSVGQTAAGIPMERARRAKSVMTPRALRPELDRSIWGLVAARATWAPVPRPLTPRGMLHFARLHPRAALPSSAQVCPLALSGAAITGRPTIQDCAFLGRFLLATSARTVECSTVCGAPAIGNR